MSTGEHFRQRNMLVAFKRWLWLDRVMGRVMGYSKNFSICSE